jgi:type II secretory pathway pseudopilin PulG
MTKNILNYVRSSFASDSAGFTLIEALVALTLLTVGLIPAFLQASNAVALSASIRNTLIAAHVAQEGIEITRSIRDSNWFAGRPFSAGLDSCDSGCRVQWDVQEVLPISGRGQQPLRQAKEAGLLQYDSGDETLFSRTMVITPVGAGELQVSSQVNWRERSGNKSFVIEYHLYDWYPQAPAGGFGSVEITP